MTDTVRAKAEGMNLEIPQAEPDYGDTDTLAS